MVHNFSGAGLRSTDVVIVISECERYKNLTINGTSELKLKILPENTPKIA